MAKGREARQSPAAKTSTANVLQGWKQIAEYLGQSVAVAQRWGRSGMPVTRQGRYATASAEDLGRWLGRESGAPGPVHIATDNNDLSSDLKRALALAKTGTRSRKAAHSRAK